MHIKDIMKITFSKKNTLLISYLLTEKFENIRVHGKQRLYIVKVDTDTVNM